MRLTRRKFLWTTGIGGASLVIGWGLLGRNVPLPESRLEGGFMPNAFIEVTATNRILFYAPRDEMGQGITTGHATLIGEELDIAPDALQIEFVPVHPAYRNPEFRFQGTGGSTSMSAHFLPLRQAAADVRQLFIEAAANDLDLEPALLTTDEGHIIDPDGRRHPYGAFIAMAARLAIPTDTPLKPRKAWKYIGQDRPRVDGIAKATGTARYGIDIDIPDLHRAVIRRPPVAGGTLAGLDANQARAMPGVVHVGAISSGVAVVAEQYWQAKSAAESLEIQWDMPDKVNVDTNRIKADYAAALASEDGVMTETNGDLEDGFAAAQHVVDLEFWTPYLAHAPMEPMNALVHIQPDRVDVWSGTQSPAGARGLVARTLGIDAEKVHVHSTYMGGSFGRRAILGHVIEATEAAAASGKPVQVLWSRENDLQHGYSRPASLMRIKAGATNAGVLTAWEATRVGANIEPGLIGLALPGLLPRLPEVLVEAAVGVLDKVTRDWIVSTTSVEGLYGDYDIENRSIRHVTCDHGLPVLVWRSVGHSYTAFAKESAIDALAQASGLDPVEFRLRNTTQDPKLANVIRLAGDAMQAMPKRQGRGLGLAAHSSFDSAVAQIADVSVDDGIIRVHKVACIIDCGLAVNPDIVRTQMEGSIIYGMSAALHGSLEVVGGAIVQSNFHDYPILRMDESPDIEVRLVESDAPPTGVGEPGVPPIAPAIANAVFAATGQRLTRLPLTLA